MSFDPAWFAFLALGLFSGFVAGLLGIGGGVVLVPLLAMLFDAQGFPRAQVLHLALGTSMATIVFTATASLRTHHRHGAVRWELLKAFTPGVLAGALLGPQLATRVPTRELALFFTGFIFLVALQMGLNLRPKAGRHLPGPWGIAAVGAGIGALSSLVAIGGGSLTVPFLAWCGVPLTEAIGTSAALGLPIALFGSLGYLWEGWSQPGLPWGSLGYVYLPAVLLGVAGSTLTAPMGANLAHRLPVARLKRIFAGVLLVLALKMLYGLL